MPRLARNRYKRGDGRFEARYVKDRREDGKAVYGSVYAATYGEVKDKLNYVVSGDDLPCHTKNTVREVLREYLNTSKHTLKPSTHDVYERYFDNYISPYFGSTRCDRLTPELLQSFVDKQLERGLSATTVQSVFGFLKSGLRETFGGVFNVKLPKSSSREVKFFSRDEQQRLEAAAKASGDIDCLFVTLCLYTGLRVGEVCGLTWEDVGFELRRLYVRRTVQRIRDDSDSNSKTKVAFLSPKSRTSARIIPLPDFLLEKLTEYKSRNFGEYVLSRDGLPIEPRNIQYRFKKLLAAADVSPANFHTTRHTFATRALENGFDVKTLSEIMGHSSAIVTLDIYAHTLDEHKRNCMGSLASVYR
jgi:integrase